MKMEQNPNNFYAALAKDIPRSFEYHFQNKSGLTGPYAEILQNFAYYHNITLDLTLLEDVPSRKEIFRYLLKGKYSILTFSNTYRQKKDGMQYSYPVEWMRKCVMVPMVNEIPKYLYIIWPYERYIWTLIFLGSIYIAVLMRFVDTRSGSIPTRSIIRNIPHALNITLYTMNMQVHLRNPPIRVFLFYTMLYLYGFILSAYHLPYMTAYNMKPVFVPPIDTAQDILDSKLKIIITNNDASEMNEHDLSGIEHVLLNVTSTQFESFLKNYNRSFAYVVSKDHWEFMRKQQNNLKQPYFHLTSVCFSSALRSFSVLTDRQYTLEFDIFSLRVQQSGLWRPWTDKAFARAVSSGYAKILLDAYPVESLNVEYFLIAWVVMTLGFSCSFLSLLMEFIISKLHFRKIK